MAFSTVPTVATSDSWTASQHNTYIKDNFAAVWVGTTAGDMDYYTSSTVKSRLAIGTSYQILRSTGSAPAWVSLSTLTANAAIVGSQATGDLIYASSATALSRVALGTANKVLRAGPSAPEWVSMLYSRQGGNSSNWSAAGNSNYTPTAPIRQKGSKSVTLSGGTGSAAVTYPNVFANRPVIYGLTVNTSSDRIIATWSDDTTSGFTIRLRDVDGGSGTYAVHWAVEGE